MDGFGRAERAVEPVIDEVGFSAEMEMEMRERRAK